MTDRCTNVPRSLTEHQRQEVEAAVLRTLCELRTLYGHDPATVLIVNPNGPLDAISARTVVKEQHSLKITKYF